MVVKTWIWILHLDQFFNFVYTGLPSTNKCLTFERKHRCYTKTKLPDCYDTCCFSKTGPMKQMLQLWERSGVDLDPDPGFGYISITLMLTQRMIARVTFKKKCFNSIQCGWWRHAFYQLLDWTLHYWSICLSLRYAFILKILQHACSIVSTQVHVIQTVLAASRQL